MITNRILKCLGYGSIGALWIALTGAAHAGLMFSISYAIADLDDVVVGTSVGLLVADTAGDGFMGISDVDGMMTNSLLGYPMSIGSALGDDRVLMRMTGATLGTGVTGFESNPVSFNTDDALWGGALNSGQDLALLYFPDGMANDGDAFGFYRSGPVTDPAAGGNSGYITPMGGGNVDIRTLTQGTILFGIAGTVPAANVSSGTISSVPEPSSLLTSLLLVGSWWLRAGRRRERRRRHVA